jgi:inward rectifier potassium channel
MNDSSSRAQRCPSTPQRRVTLSDDSYAIAHGLRSYFWHDIYHGALTMSWPAFFASALLMFLSFNALFALLYLAGGNGIANQSPAGFLGAFFFSVETLATVGYGDMHPQTIFAHSVATLEIFVGMSGIALTTGLVFARFSRPQARIMFSKYAVVRPLFGQTTLMLRAANQRLNVIAEASARLRLLREETSEEGYVIRRIHDLKLVRDQHPIFQLGWNLMHVIDESSPLFGETAASLAASEALLMLMVEGVDEASMQTMQARHNWSHETIRWSHALAELIYEEDGITHVDYSRFDEVTPLHDRAPEENFL